MSSRFKLALIQLSVGSNKTDNLSRAVSKISEAVQRGANIVSLPGNHCTILPIISLIDVMILMFRMFQLSIRDSVFQGVRRVCPHWSEL